MVAYSLSFILAFSYQAMKAERKKKTMAKKKEMDKLALENAQALACGMSYGKWKAKQEPVKIVKQEYPADWRKCEHCGKPFKPVQGKRFCDIYCRDRAYRKKQNEIMREYMRKYRKKDGVAV